MEEVRPASWTAVRVARPARDLTRSARFYSDLIGLPPLGGFENHDGYNGVFFALPGGAELELTAGPAQPAPSTDEDLLVLYVQTQALIEAHLGECEGCAEHLRQIRITLAVMGGIGEEDLDPAARQDLMEIYRRWRRDRPA